VTEEPGTRSEDRIDAAMIAAKWRQETEPPERRAWRYDTARTAAFAFMVADAYREWSRHRGVKPWE
jgi:hypothetical protein